MSLFCGRKEYKVARPDWVPVSTRSLHKTLDLIESGRLPEVLTKPMLVVPIRYVLRSLYGSNMKAAAALFKYALGQEIEDFRGRLWHFWRYRICMRSEERDWNELLAELKESSEEDEQC